MSSVPDPRYPRGPVPAAERAAYRNTMQGWALIYAAPLMWASAQWLPNFSIPWALFMWGLLHLIRGMVDYYFILRAEAHAAREAKRGGR